ncbi:polysaccharide deacetylase family protein [Winogradskyella sp.]|uniref:polysaccharide deacetylase family protein n=1 Tax=Winogradskyella sp. TaxID=1883156 RepID=UPI003F6B40FD
MKLIPAKTPGFVKTLFPSFVWNINTAKKELYLTFDDGPTPEITNWVLQTLKDYNAKATFFCIGNNIEKYPEIFKNILSENHTVGNHTYNHLKGWNHKTKDYIDDIIQTQNLIDSKLVNEALGAESLFRPPYGKFKVKQGKQIQDLGYKIVLWDVLSYDWDKTITEEACYNNVTSAAKEGSIIVFHDSIKASKNLMYVLPKVLKYYSEKGFKFKSI